jgi:hypothetical protein
MLLILSFTARHFYSQALLPEIQSALNPNMLPILSFNLSLPDACQEMVYNKEVRFGSFQVQPNSFKYHLIIRREFLV